MAVVGVGVLALVPFVWVYWNLNDPQMARMGISLTSWLGTGFWLGAVSALAAAGIGGAGMMLSE
jgi:hypothetical protein